MRWAKWSILNPRVSRAPALPHLDLAVYPVADLDPDLEADLPFIVSTGRDEDDPATRKLIRSHVMLRKNKGKPRPTKRRKQLSWESVPARKASEDRSEVRGRSSVVPRRVGSDWSFTTLADEIEPATLVDILKC